MPIDWTAAPITAAQARSIVHATALAPAINLWYGAVSAGKTVGSLVRFLMDVANAPARGEIALIGRTRDTLYRNVMAPLQDASFYGAYSAQVEYNRGAPTARIFGRTVHIIGASDVRAEAVIRGITLCLAYVDEATLLAEEFFSMLVSRMRVEGAKILATTNPDSTAHWLNREYVMRADELGHRLFHFHIRDNAQNLPAGYIEGLEAQYTGLWRKRFIDGEWSIASGAIYEDFNPEQHVITDLPVMDRILALGVDYGTTNPTAGILIGLAQGRLYAMAEWSPTKSTDGELSAHLARWLTEHDQPAWIFVDPAAASFKLQLHRDGVGRVTNADNSVVDGIRTVASLLASGHLAIHESCTELIREIPGYVWDEKQTAKGIDAPVKADDHFCDALRYGVASSRMLWQAHLPNLREPQRQPDHRLEAA